MYKAGERLNCTVISKEPDSYRVTLCERGLPGVLCSAEALEIGASLEVCFVCMHGDLVVVKQIDTATLCNISERLSQQSLEQERVLSSEADATLANDLLQLFVRCGSLDAQAAGELGADLDGRRN